MQRVCNEFDLNFLSRLDIYFEFDLELVLSIYLDVRDLACTLNDIYLLRSCPYGMDVSLMTPLSFMLRIGVAKS